MFNWLLYFKIEKPLCNFQDITWWLWVGSLKDFYCGFYQLCFQFVLNQISVFDMAKILYTSIYNILIKCLLFVDVGPTLKDHVFIVFINHYIHYPSTLPLLSTTSLYQKTSTFLTKPPKPPISFNFIPFSIRIYSMFCWFGVWFPWFDFLIFMYLMGFVLPIRNNL